MRDGMSTLAEPKPYVAPSSPEALVERVDLLRLDATRRLDPKRQAEMGQFMTPAPIARFMASMFEGEGRSLRLLDAGAGIGSLTAAWVAEMCSRKDPPREMSVVAYEVDPALIEYLRETLECCRTLCEHAGIRFEAAVRHEDFIVAGVDALRGGLFAGVREEFDAAILNPPYRKIHSHSTTRRLLETLGAETTNLYAGFLSLAVGFLRPQGELVAITPRSFCNGPYFRSFRRSLLDTMALERVHCFEARDRAFSDDEVLQENVVFRALKAPARQGRVVISSSQGPDDPWPTWREVDFSRIVKPGDPERFIHIPADALSEAIEERMQQFKASLPELGLEVSTGRVVDFRSAEFLHDQPGPKTVPLIYPAHLVEGYVQWPRSGGKKPNALELAPETEEMVIPRGHYVLVKRFSSKEERRRIVAAIYEPKRLASASHVAFENHLNYFHAHGRPLSQDLAKGLAAFLNATLVDCSFREWSGHTQVNASDLRRFRYPTRDQLEALGATLPDVLIGQNELDRRIEEDLLRMPRSKKSADPVRAKRRLQEAISVLKDLGLPREQQNERSALTLLALLDVKPSTPWRAASDPLRGITEMMGFFAEHYGKTYAPNTRETVRRFTVHQFVQAGLAVPNPDKPSRPTNSPQAVYQIEASALALLRMYTTPEWENGLTLYLTAVETLQRRYAREREIQRIPLTLPTGARITLSPGGQNVLVQKIVDEFCPCFTPGAKPLYVGDTAEKWAYFDEEAFKALSVAVEAHGKMPDVVVYHEAKGWLVLVEAVTSHGPVDPKRRQELKELFKDCKAGLVFVTAFLTRRDLVKYLGDIAWETEVWVAESPTHLIHFNGERFLGPFED
jgi:adenine-specific DNA-methyltransferase